MTGKISEDTDLGTVIGAELIPVVSGGTNKRTTPAQIAAYIASLAQTLTSKTINAASNTISNIATSMFAANVIDTDGTLAANSDTRLPTQKAVKAYVAAYIAAQDVEVLKGAVDCSTNPNYPAADAGHVYRVSVAGKIGGASGVNVEIGDRIECFVDGTASGSQAAVGASWFIIQANIDGAVVGPASAVDATPAVFDGTTARLIKNITYSAFKTALSLVKGDVGLGSVDNTSDATKNAAAVALTNKTSVTSATFVQTSPPGTSPSLHSGGSTVSIANNASASIAISYGLVMVCEATALALVGIYLVEGGSVTLISSGAGALWVAPTTTPAAGKASVCYDGSTSIKIYNNRGGTSNFNVMQLRIF